MKPPSQRQLRVGELVRHALAEIITRGDIHGLNFGGSLVSVSEVRMSPDLKIATCFIAPVGPGNVQSMIKGLAGSQRDLRMQIGQRLKLRFTPTLRFKPDTSYDSYAAVDSILRSPDVAQDTDPVRGEDQRDEDR
ncbi:MAG: 30S ribosome-binding factor RbfA [Pseudomonadota bacterium]